ncbi:hypothetical protein ACOWK8_07825 [Helicobacter pylori]
MNFFNDWNDLSFQLGVLGHYFSPNSFFQSKTDFKPPKQKSQSSLAFGMNATNSWYHIPIHSYLA